MRCIVLWILALRQYDGRHCRVSLRYGELACVVRVQSVTWAAVVGCPCDWWLVVVSPLPSGFRIKSGMTGWGGEQGCYVV